jgi:hypothetical protein
MFRENDPTSPAIIGTDVQNDITLVIGCRANSDDKPITLSFILYALEKAEIITGGNL